MNAIDDIEEVAKPKMSLFFELQSVMRSILLDLDVVERTVTNLEMRFNPKPYVMPKRPSSQKPSPTRNYFPPAF